MQLSQIPAQLPIPFAANGTKNTIPEASQIGITPGAASLNDGFPPLTFTPIAGGGVPPSGADFNGILNLLSQNIQWQNAGGLFPYSASFSAAIGGYPKSALLAKASGTGLWLNLVDNNTSDPDSGGAGWGQFDPATNQSWDSVTAADSGTANAYVITLSPAPASLTPGMLVNVESIANTNTGASTLAVNGLSSLPILLAKGTALSGGELTAGYGAILRLNYAGTAWETVWTGAGTFLPPASQSNASLTLGQAQSLFQPNSGGLQFAVGSASSLTANAYLAGYQAVGPVTFPANFAGSSMSALVAATAAQTINFVKVPSGSTTGTVVGTASFAASGTVASLATTGGAVVSLATGDSLLAQVSSTADATLATIIGTIVGSL